MKIAMIGTRGVPAQYGGFETAVEEIGRRLVERGHKVSVYCRGLERHHSREYLGMQLVHLPAIRRKSFETLSHSALSVTHAMFAKPDAAFLFNAGNAPVIWALKAARVPTAVHMDGLEWKRAKWAGAGAKYYKWAEGFCARSGMPLIADARGIQEYLEKEYDVSSEFIAYGAPIIRPTSHPIAKHGLKPGEYHLCVARIEPENHVDMIVRGYSESSCVMPLVVVGATPYSSAHEADVRNYARIADVRFLGSVWDQDELNSLYTHCLSYLHGHSVGGTNPSLLRALGSGAPVTAFDVNFNREVTGGHARFFRDPSSVGDCLQQDEENPRLATLRGIAGSQHAEKNYSWDQVATAYECLANRMVKDG